YNSGYDPERREAQPGLVLIARCIEDALGEGAPEYDFLRGTERYKYDLGGVDRVVYRVTVPS
ncbi:MAG: GNAT family N-acetyltransferase, partial [Deltaproteobacteria bacterium]|nr:GNAT family N-acetyltransferase [Deltaproteobacteria bacterium]